MSDILFVHNNFPGQFGALATALRADGHRCAAIGSTTAAGVPGVDTRRWKLDGEFRPSGRPLSARAEIDLIRARHAATCALELKAEGFDPALIVGHPGWGETLLLGEIFPRARTIAYAEFFYRSRGADVGFDPEFARPPEEDSFRVHAKNMGLALAYAEADRLVAPTPFQASLLPASLKGRTTIIHEGVDTDAVKPIHDARIALPGVGELKPDVPLITFVNRRFEPLRGYHVFMRALPKILAAMPDARVVLVGGDPGAGYGTPPPAGQNWRDVFLDEVKHRLDPTRLHFVGRLPHQALVALMSRSNAHIYLTYPFVLSWSLLDAMAAESLIVASDTAPVRDVVENGRNGLLVEFFDTDALADTVVEACRNPERYRGIRQAARRTVVEHFDRRRNCLPAWLDLVRSLL
ncbi:glycosyltransferase [Chthonobacter albigriseus]|uniref:glycosyltransferase n=1 Tax=Chthonobacter albigriseus TaxID=1683161 RepID=UPI0015EF76C9